MLLAKISHYTYVRTCVPAYVHDSDIGFSHWSVANGMHIIIMFANYSMGCKGEGLGQRKLPHNYYCHYSTCMHMCGFFVSKNTFILFRKFTVNL